MEGRLLKKYLGVGRIDCQKDKDFEFKVLSVWDWLGCVYTGIPQILWVQFETTIVTEQVFAVKQIIFLMVEGFAFNL